MPIKKRPLADFPEIEVFGRRPRIGRLPSFREISRTTRSAPGRGEDVGRPTVTQEEEEEETFVPPAVPIVIDEIVATATRVSRVPTFLGAGGLLTGAAFLGAAIVDRLSQLRLDEAGRVATRETFPGPDTPVVTIPQAEVLPEVIVTARRIPTRPTVDPTMFTFISPDQDPFEMVPVVPRILPQVPTADPGDLAVPQEIPTIPRVRPTVFPLPLEIPLVAPRIRPGVFTDPAVRPQPFTNPLIDPQVDPQVDPETRADPLTLIDPRVVGSPGPTAFPFRLPLFQTDPKQARPANCPPCKKPKKEKEKERKRCFKKLVKEGLFPSDDQEFRWVPIDCFTGREL